MLHPLGPVRGLITRIRKLGGCSQINRSCARSIEGLALRNSFAIKKRAYFVVVRSPVEPDVAILLFVFWRRHASAVDTDAMFKRRLLINARDAVEILVARIFALMLL